MKLCGCRTALTAQRFGNRMILPEKALSDGRAYFSFAWAPLSGSSAAFFAL